jgi:hypothetical protein
LIDALHVVFRIGGRLLAQRRSGCEVLVRAIRRRSVPALAVAGVNAATVRPADAYMLVDAAQILHQYLGELRPGRIAIRTRPGFGSRRRL